MKISQRRVTVTHDQLVQEQAGARTHLTFLLTLACPLSCEHCIVNAGPDKGHTTMPLEVAQWYGSQMPELYDRGIRLLSLTGGEPFLARQQLSVMSNAGADAGMECGVVTAAHWATSPKRAKALVAAFPNLHTWDISIDSYHLDYLPFERVRTAYAAVKEAGRRAIIRFTFHEPFTVQDQKTMEILDSFADPDDVISSRLRSTGRASGQPISESFDGTTFVKPCLTKGLVIRYDGSMSPCCINLVEERRHPFQLGDPLTKRLRDIHAEYLTHPLLQMIRVLGFGEIVSWLKRAGLESVLPDKMPEDVCDVCPHIMTNAIAANLAAELCSQPETRLKIAVLADRVLGEPEMLNRTIRELHANSTTVEGLSAAEQIADVSSHPNERLGAGND
jgi:pyruvate-formate lyase-activating enzyme